MRFTHNFLADGEYRITMTDLDIGQYARSLESGTAGLLEGNGGQVLTQLWGILATIVWCAIATFVILIVTNILVGVRVSQAVEVEGLDINLHGEVVQ
jgi:Amt family ammonium transporter